jgi:hypothetical protein
VKTVRLRLPDDPDREPLAIETRALGPPQNGSLDQSTAERMMRVAEEKADADHHRLPQFYLKRFAGKAGKLEVVDPKSGAMQLLLPKEAFAEAGYYTGRLGEGGEPLALVEVLYETIEDAAAKAIRRLVKGTAPGALSVDERAKVAEFLATQMTRGESFKQTTGDFIDEISKTVLKLRATHAGDSWPDFVKSVGGSEDEQRMTAKQFVEAIDNDRFKIVPSAEQLLNLRLVAVEQMAEIFMFFSWHCVRFEQPCLFTSEEPVTYWREPTPENQFFGIGAETTDEVRIALSPRLALVLVRPQFGYIDGQVVGTQTEAALLNFGSLIFRDGVPVVRSPDVQHHPLPRSMFTDSPVMPVFRGGPVIRG